MLDAALDPVREKFTCAFHACGNASEALRIANPKARKWKAETVHVKASNMLKEDKVQVRLQQLQAEAREKHGVTIESLTKELEEARAFAREIGQAAPMVTAVMGKAKLHGLIEDKTKLSGDADGVPAIAVTITRTVKKD